MFIGCVVHYILDNVHKELILKQNAWLSGVFFIISLLIGGNILFTYWCWTLDFFSQRIVVRCVFMCMWGKWVSLHASQLISPMTLLSYSAFFCLHQYVWWTIILLSMADWVFTPLPTPWLCVCICVCVSCWRSLVGMANLVTSLLHASQKQGLLMWLLASCTESPPFTTSHPFYEFVSACVRRRGGTDG